MQPVPPGTWPSLPIVGRADVFGVRRILCIGKNYAAHLAEMGYDAKEPPVHFVKSPDALLPAIGETRMPYPPRTANLHHEVELVVALGAGGADVPAERALELVYGYAIGLDMTRRDLQAAAKKAGGPWCAAKDFDAAAVVGPIHPVDAVGHVAKGAIELSVNGQPRQQGDLSGMSWPVAALLAELSALMTLRPGDLVFTGTPEGVGPVVPGDRMVARIEGLGELVVDVVER
jgi:fumarylpyruvate hydrolase